MQYPTSGVAVLTDVMMMATGQYESAVFCNHWLVMLATDTVVEVVERQVGRKTTVTTHEETCLVGFSSDGNIPLIVIPMERVKCLTSCQECPPGVYWVK